MTKNQRIKCQKFKPNQGNDNTLGKHESVHQSFKIETPGFSLKDFPELKTSFKSRSETGCSQPNRNGLHSQKTYLSVVSNTHGKNLSEAFPASHEFECKKVSKGNLKNEKEDGRKSQTTSANENQENGTDSQKILLQENNTKSETSTSKKITHIPRRNPHKKKRTDPIEFSFQNIFAMHQQPLNKMKKSNTFKKKFQRRENKELLSGNYLDSSNPKRSRGKHREIKKKKPTKLKLEIIKERIIKQKLKENSIDFSECFRLIETLDFKMEIKNYLEELKKRRSTKSEKIVGSNQGSCEEKSEHVGNEKVATKRESTLREQKKKKIVQIPSEDQIKFTSKFREYCDNILTQNLNSSVNELINELVKLQDRAYARDPIKAKAKRRHVSGLREVNKYLVLKKVKLIVIAPNLEKMEMKGGVYDTIEEMKSTADAQCVPYAFALDRYSLGRCTKKNVPVSAFAVLNCEGLEELFENTLSHLKQAKERFLELSKGTTEKKENEAKEEKEEKEKTKEQDVNARVISSLMSVFKEKLLLEEPKKTERSETFRSLSINPNRIDAEREGLNG